MGNEFSTTMMNSVDVDTGEKLNIVIDKRFARKNEAQSTIRDAIDSGYKTIVVLDVDADLETSLERVSRRDENGVDPKVPDAAVIEGFKGTRVNRLDLINYITETNEERGDLNLFYFLYKTDVPSSKPHEPTRVASIEDKKYMIDDHRLLSRVLST